MVALATFLPLEELGFRHGRACPGHPRLFAPSEDKTWMPGTSPGMTKKPMAV
jgi:hypothetical protein